MKLYLFAVFISTLLILNTVLAVNGPRYIRRADPYQIRATVPDSDVDDALPTNAGNMQVASQMNDELSEEEDANQPPADSSISQSPAFAKLKLCVALTSVLANIARIPENVAAQIDSTITNIQKTYPTNTNVGAYLASTQFFLRNPRALRKFDLLDQAGLGKLPGIIASMPNIFVPIINAIDRFFESLVERFAKAIGARYYSMV